jgi:hypothetical protein
MGKKIRLSCARRGIAAMPVYARKIPSSPVVRLTTLPCLPDFAANLILRSPDPLFSSALTE